MEEIINVSFDVFIHPNEIKNIQFKSFLKNKFEDELYKGSYVQNIYKVISHKYGKVLSNGYITINIVASCGIIKPNVGDKLNSIITHSNKIGAFISTSKISIFIPKEYCNDQNIPNLGDNVTIEIIGKRLEDKISCIAKQLN